GEFATFEVYCRSSVPVPEVGRETTTIDLPSGAQDGRSTTVLESVMHEGCAEVWSSRAKQRSGSRPRFSAMNATVFPSGEMAGRWSRKPGVVSGRAEDGWPSVIAQICAVAGRNL